MNTKSKTQRLREMSARYPRVIEWSPEDATFVGSAPPPMRASQQGFNTRPPPPSLNSPVFGSALFDWLGPLLAVLPDEDEDGDNTMTFLGVKT